MADILLIGASVVSGGAFGTTAEEDSALALEGRGHTVTRVQASTLTTQPAASSYDVAIHMDGTPGADEVLRATDAGACGLIACNTYYWANAYGHTALATGPTGTGNSDADWEILDTTEISWTAGYAVNDTVAVWPFDVYQEAVQGVVSGSTPVIATVSPGNNTCVLVPAGVTNLASATTSANVALFNIWADIWRLNSAGLQILDDVIDWAIGVNSYAETPAFTASAAMTVTDAQGRFDAPAFTASAEMTVTSVFGQVESVDFTASAALTVESVHAPPGVDPSLLLGWWDASTLAAGAQPWDDISGAGGALTAWGTPAVIENARGALSAFNYDIADTEYHSYVLSGAVGQAMTYAVAFRADSVAETAVNLGNGSPLVDRSAWSGFSLHQTGGIVYATAFAYDTAYRYSSPVELTLGQWHVAILTLDAGASTLTFAVDGGTPVQITGLTGETDRTGVFIGSGFTNYFDGGVGEVVISEEEVSGASLDLLTTYLTSRWLENFEEFPGFDVGVDVSVEDLQGWVSAPEFSADVALTVDDLLSITEAPSFTVDVAFTATVGTLVSLSRLTPEIDISQADTGYSLVSWSAVTPPETFLTVEVTYDGGSNWYECSNGGALPNLPGSLSGVTAQFRQTLSQLDTTSEWPTLNDFRVEVGSPIRLDNGSISYSFSKPQPGATDQSSVKRTASLIVADPLPDYADPGVAIFKPYVEMQAASTGNWVRFYLGEFESLAPPKTDDGTRITLNLRLASREQKLARADTTDYVVAPVNRNIVLFVREDVLVDEFGETDFDFPTTTDTIPDDIVFPPGTSWLEVVNTALESVGWSNLVVNGDGQWTAAPATVTKTPEWVYPTATPVVRASSIEPFTGDIPNVVVVRARRGPSLPVEGNGQITLRNLATGPFSIAGRGGLEVTEELTVEAADQEALERIGIARAEAMFRGGGDRLQLTAGLNPLHDEQDSVLVTKERFGITDARFWVTGWAINLGRVESMATMELTLERQVANAESSAQVSSGGAATSIATAEAVVVVPTYAESPDDTYACSATSHAQGLVFDAS
jgi:hypothetical protein